MACDAEGIAFKRAAVEQARLQADMNEAFGKWQICLWTGGGDCAGEATTYFMAQAAALQADSNLAAAKAAFLRCAVGLAGKHKKKKPDSH